ncbi:MAG: hypothetical protein Ct9H300mP1_38490 [Planctomycetaceae bacterium]|nr:MAG: hypothetical protein Ct9H300mP1_38490 [Planctomycetaceae bacterium]
MFSAVVIGGDPGGQVIGASDKMASDPVKRAYYPADMGATIYSAWHRSLEPGRDRPRRPHQLNKGEVIAPSTGGLNWVRNGIGFHSADQASCCWERHIPMAARKNPLVFREDACLKFPPDGKQSPWAEGYRKGSRFFEGSPRAVPQVLWIGCADSGFRQPGDRAGSR